MQKFLAEETNLIVNHKGSLKKVTQFFMNLFCSKWLMQIWLCVKKKSAITLSPDETSDDTIKQSPKKLTPKRLFFIVCNF